jgi:hypothetical protein
MKRVYFSFPLTLLLLSICSRGLAQCGNGCPAGSITTLPANGVIPAGSVYCISGIIDNSSVNYTINGEILVEPGAILTTGTVTLNKTGSIVVTSGARMNTSAFTGQSTAPASAIANVTICTGGYLSITGAFNQWETNFVLNDYAILLVDGSWTSSATDVYADIGMGALVELCATLNINTNGFFTETSNSPSYLVVDAEVSESVVNGWISTKQSASMIRWTSVGTSAFVSHPAAYTCNGCGNSTMAPPGTTPGVCGAVANNYLLTTLPVTILDFSAQPAARDLQLTASLSQELPVSQVVLESSADGHNFAPAPYTATVLPAGAIATGAAAGAVAASYVFTLPTSAAADYYRVRVLSGAQLLYSQILAPAVQPAGPASALVFPDPATNFIYLQQPGAAGYTSASVINVAGQVLQRNTLPANGGTIRLDLPHSLPAGIYFVRFTGPGLAPMTVRVLRAP